MKSELIKTKKKDNLLYIILNRPEKLNTLIEPMRHEISSLIDSLNHRDDIRVCILTGSGRGFCAGGDIKVMEQIIQNSSFECIQTFLDWGKSIICGIRNLPIPVIAAVNGPAAGAGMNLALACDIRIASDKATFGQTFINIGLHPDWGGTYFLPRMSGIANALEMFWTGRIIDATDALKMNIVNRVVPHNLLMEEVEKLATNIASHSKKTISIIKKGVYQGLSGDLESILEYEAKAQDECIRSGEARKGMTSFLKEREKRKKK